MITLRKPPMSHGDNTEDIRVYLYKLTDELEYAFSRLGGADSGERTESDIRSVAEAVRSMLRLGGDRMSDFVTDTGIDGAFTWRKWQSGIAEGWQRVSLAAGASAVSIPLPSGLFASPPVATVTPGIGNLTVTVSAVTGTADGTPSFINLHVIGRWR